MLPLWTSQARIGASLTYDTVRYYALTTERFVSADGAVPGNAFGGIDRVILAYRPVERRVPSFVRLLNLENEQVVG
jgi:hypothetical protein